MGGKKKLSRRAACGGKLGGLTVRHENLHSCRQRRRRRGGRVDAIGDKGRKEAKVMIKHI